MTNDELLDVWANADGVASRQKEMLRVARSFADMQALAQRLSSAGLVVAEAEPIRDERRAVRIAWLLSAHKPSPDGKS